MKQLYYRHAKTNDMYQKIGDGQITLSDGATLADMDTIFVVNGGDAPPYVFVSDKRTQVRKDDLVLEVVLQAGSVIQSGDSLVLYRGTDGRYWARPSAEFYDGRFIELDAELNPVVVPLDMAAISVVAVKELAAQAVTTLGDGSIAFAAPSTGKATK